MLAAGLCNSGQKTKRIHAIRIVIRSIRAYRWSHPGAAAASQWNLESTVHYLYDIVQYRTARRRWRRAPDGLCSATVRNSSVRIAVRSLTDRATALLATAHTRKNK
jgi:hypothetical protein